LDPSTWKFDVDNSPFDVCHDKGTYDAVCLNPDHAEEKRMLYIENLKSLLHSSSWFIITSCNWTNKEIREQFSEGI